MRICLLTQEHGTETGANPMPCPTAPLARDDHLGYAEKARSWHIRVRICSWQEIDHALGNVRTPSGRLADGAGARRRVCDGLAGERFPRRGARETRAGGLFSGLLDRYLPGN